MRFPQLTLLVRYLAFTHGMLRAQAEPTGRAGQALSGSAEDSETEELLARLLGKDRDPPPLPPDQASHPSQAMAQRWLHTSTQEDLVSLHSCATRCR